MADKQSAVAKLHEKRAKEAKEYKTSHDPERTHHLVATIMGLRDFPAATALSASFARELAALSSKQADLDAKEKEEHDKELAEASAADAKEHEPEETESSPPTRSAQGRSR